jgi:aminomuconate-semialdehyde/2-hydroxymuconate-6-semialdehyde dehydrogenase
LKLNGSLLGVTMQKIENYINGKLVAPLDNKYINNYNPAIGEVYSYIPDSDKEDIELAIQAAEKVFPTWSTTPTVERSKLLLKISELIERDLDKLALAESIDNGKPYLLAKSVDIPRASSNFRFFATAIMHFSSESHVMEDKAINYTIRNP